MLRAHPETICCYDPGEAAFVLLGEWVAKVAPFVGVDGYLGAWFWCPLAQIVVNGVGDCAAESGG